ncbi:MAG: hypothetical protein R2793_02590 [Flavobacteriaceae bacterium]
MSENRTYAFFNLKAGVGFRINERHHLYASYGKAHRELRRNDFEEGVFTAEKLNDYEFRDGGSIPKPRQ